MIYFSIKGFVGLGVVRKFNQNMPKSLKIKRTSDRKAKNQYVLPNIMTSKSSMQKQTIQKQIIQESLPVRKNGHENQDMANPMK